MTVIVDMDLKVKLLKSQRQEKKKTFNTYVGRRNSIKNIINMLDKKLDDDIQDINGQVSKCVAEFQKGLKGISKTEMICSNMDSEKEKRVSSDSKISACRYHLSNEVNRCQTHINNLDCEIKQLENEIRKQGGTINFWE